MQLILGLYFGTFITSTVLSAIHNQPLFLLIFFVPLGISIMILLLILWWETRRNNE